MEAEDLNYYRSLCPVNPGLINDLVCYVFKNYILLIMLL